MKDVTMDETDGWLGWLLGGIVSVVAALATAVTTLWSRSEARNAEAIRDLSVRVTDLAKENGECEKDRRALFGRVSKLEAQVSYLEGDGKHEQS
jgi:hypothetical protein